MCSSVPSPGLVLLQQADLAPCVTPDASKAHAKIFAKVHKGPRRNVQEAGKPRFVSLLAYLNSSWGLNDHAETLFLDSTTDTGAFVRPKPGRVILLDQDVLHRASAPALAARRPRYSLVWKLLACPACAFGTSPSATCMRSPATSDAAAPAAAGPDGDVVGTAGSEGPGGYGAPAVRTGTAAVGSCGSCGGARGAPRPASVTPSPGVSAHESAGAGAAAVQPAPRPARSRTVSILLPDHSSVTAFGSARKMRDLQDSVARGVTASALPAKRSRG